jgi:formamidopyrimidine-DNA glycosylase
VGNIYRAEILFVARVHPSLPGDPNLNSSPRPSP